MRQLRASDEDWQMVIKLLKGDPIAGSPTRTRMRMAELARQLNMQMQFPKSEQIEDFEPNQKLPSDVPLKDTSDNGWNTPKW